MSMYSIIPAQDLKGLSEEMKLYEADRSDFFHHVRMTFRQSRRTFLLLRRMIEKHTTQVMNFIKISEPMYWMVYQGLEVKLYRSEGEIVLEWYGEPQLELLPAST